MENWVEDIKERYPVVCMYVCVCVCVCLLEKQRGICGVVWREGY